MYRYAFTFLQPKIFVAKWNCTFTLCYKADSSPMMLHFDKLSVQAPLVIFTQTSNFIHFCQTPPTRGNCNANIPVWGILLEISVFLKRK
ncbi:hypothetical protein FKM82_016813 [Ascaphus truei]